MTDLAAGMMAFMATTRPPSLQPASGVTPATIGYFYFWVVAIGLLMLGVCWDCCSTASATCGSTPRRPLIALGRCGCRPPATSGIRPSYGLVRSNRDAVPATTAQVSRYAPAGHVGEFMGLQQAMGGVSRVLGPVWAGAAFQHLGVSSPFWLAGLLMASVGALAWGAGAGEAATAAASAVVEPRVDECCAGRSDGLRRGDRAGSGRNARRAAGCTRRPYVI